MCCTVLCRTCCDSSMHIYEFVIFFVLYAILLSPLLLQIYAARAAGDKEVFSLILRELMSGSGSSGGSGDENPVPAVSTDTIDEFCKNIYHLRTLSTSKLSEEYQHATGVTSACGGLDRLRDVCQETKYDLFDDPVQVRVKCGLWNVQHKVND